MERVESDILVRRFTTISGISSIILYLIVSILLFNAPKIGDSYTTVFQYRNGNAESTAILIAVYIEGLCILSTFSFLTGLWVLLRRSEQGSAGLFSTLGLLSGYVIFTLALCAFAFVYVIGYRAVENPDDPNSTTQNSLGSLSAPTSKFLWDLTWLMINLTGFPTALSMFGYSTSMLINDRVGHRARLLGWIGYGVGVIHLISAGAVASSGLLSPSGISIYISPFVYYLWIVAVSLSIWNPHTWHNEDDLERPQPPPRVRIQSSQPYQHQLQPQPHQPQQVYQSPEHHEPLLNSNLI